MRKRNRQLLVRLSDSEYLHLKKQAELAGLKMEPLMRSLLLDVQLRPRPPCEYTALLRELSAMGNNLNQIARLANAEKTIRPETMAEVARLQSEIWKKVKHL